MREKFVLDQVFIVKEIFCILSKYWYTGLLRLVFNWVQKI
jgi:hypothetical protein